VPTRSNLFLSKNFVVMLNDFLQFARVQPFAFAIWTDLDHHAIIFHRAKY